MNPTPTQFAELQKTYIEALNALTSTLVNATEQVAALNLAASQALLNDASETSRHLISSKDPKQAMALAAGLAQPAAEKIAGYSRNAYGIVSGVGAELYKIVEVQVAEGRRKVAEMVEMSLKNAPAGSEAAVTFLQGALSASNSAYDTVTKATKKASELAEANLAASVAVASDVTKALSPKAI
jgi:phasin family protein